MKPNDIPTRRQLLAGLGTVGLLTVGTSFARATLWKEPPFTRYTYAKAAGQNLLEVAWYETYNDVFQESQLGSDEATDSTTWNPEDTDSYVSYTGPVVTLPDVKPGDHGTLLVGLSAVSNHDVNVWFRPTVHANLEGGVTEPEHRDPREHSDETNDDRGELADAVELTIWHDNGLLPGDADSGDGQYTSLELLLQVNEPLIVIGTLENPILAGRYNDPAYGYTLSDGIPLDFTTSNAVGCLKSKTQEFVGIRWHVPKTVGNVIQTDSVEFEFAFAAVKCGLGGKNGTLFNPFAETIDDSENGGKR